MFFRLAVSSSSKRARGASNFNSAILPAMSLIIEREREYRGATGEFGVAAERVSEISRFLFFSFVPFLFTRPRAALPDEVSRVEVTAKATITRPRHEGDATHKHTARDARAITFLRRSGINWNRLTWRGMLFATLAVVVAVVGDDGGAGCWWKMIAGRHGDRWWARWCHESSLSARADYILGPSFSIEHLPCISVC